MMACYKQFLEQYNLTFTQYLTLIVLWENKTMRVKDLGNVLHLDSGTLTPLLKKLTFKGYIQRTQGHKDEREVFINVTEEGWCLKDHFCDIPKKVSAYLDITDEEFDVLFSLLYKILNNMEVAQKIRQ